MELLEACPRTGNTANALEEARAQEEQEPSGCTDGGTRTVWTGPPGGNFSRRGRVTLVKPAQNQCSCFKSTLGDSYCHLVFGRRSAGLLCFSAPTDQKREMGSRRADMTDIKPTLPLAPIAMIASSPRSYRRRLELGGSNQVDQNSGGLCILSL